MTGFGGAPKEQMQGEGVVSNLRPLELRILESLGGQESARF